MPLLPSKSKRLVITNALYHHIYMFRPQKLSKAKRLAQVIIYCSEWCELTIKMQCSVNIPLLGAI